MIEHVRAAAGRGAEAPGRPDRGHGLGRCRHDGGHGGSAALARQRRVSKAPPGERGLQALFETGGASIAELAGLSGWTAARLVRHAAAAGWRPRGGAAGRNQIERSGGFGAAATAAETRWRRLRGDKAGGDVAARAAEPADRAALVKRLTDAFERQVAEIEARVGEPGATGERDARTLAVLAKTLETLIDLDRSARAETPDADEEGALDGLREDLARRLDRLRGAR